MLQVDLLPRNDERVPLVQEAMALQADNNTLALAVQDLRATLGAQQKGIDNMNWQLEQKTKQVRGQGECTQPRVHLFTNLLPCK